jgi:hypothetical protein
MVATMPHFSLIVKEVGATCQSFGKEEWREELFGKNGGVVWVANIFVFCSDYAGLGIRQLLP